MFERFTDRARRVVVLAQEEARLLNHNYIGTEHLLLGLIHEGEGVAATVLETLGVSLERTRAQVEEIIGHGDTTPAEHIPFTPRAKKVLEMSLREALQLGHNYIGTEHILLGMIREGEGVAAQLLVKQGLDLDRARQAVIQVLSGYQREIGTEVAGGEPRRDPGAATGPGPMMGFWAQVYERRCSFCLRSERRVARIVRGRAAWICDECVGRAADLVADAGEGDAAQLRLRPRFQPQAQTEDAERAVEAAFETVFGGDASVDERLAFVEDSEGLRPLVEQLVTSGRARGAPDIWVDVVRFISADEAEVHWSPTLVGGGRIPLYAFAVLDAGTWKVSRQTFEQVASLVGFGPEPPGAEPGVAGE